MQAGGPLPTIEVRGRRRVDSEGRPGPLPRSRLHVPSPCTVSMYRLSTCNSMCVQTKKRKRRTEERKNGRRECGGHPRKWLRHGAIQPTRAPAMANIEWRMARVQHQQRAPLRRGACGGVAPGLLESIVHTAACSQHAWPSSRPSCASAQYDVPTLVVRCRPRTCTAVKSESTNRRKA